jgi:hypothetical protein
MTATIADLLAELSADIDERLAAMRRVDAIRSVASCTSADSAEAVRHRLEIAQAMEDDVPVAGGVLQCSA